MAVLVTDSWLSERLITERAATGADRFDEVWEGTYMMAPMPNDEHQYLVLRISYILEDVIGVPGLGAVRPGVNLSDRRDDWKQDYRVPDVAVFLREGAAENCDTHWRGGADFLVEITSPDDHSRDKIPFYSRLGVRELLIVDRDPWMLELYRCDEGELRLAGQSTVEAPVLLTSASVPLTFQLAIGTPRPQIEVKQVGSDRRWLV